MDNRERGGEEDEIGEAGRLLGEETPMMARFLGGERHGEERGEEKDTEQGDALRLAAFL